jgi:serine/threonine-protein kinase
MERLNGQSLRVVLEKKGRLELSHAYHIGIDLLDALDHAHDKGVIHRDVKPDNIFLHRTSGGVTVTKLLDFGIVSVLDGGFSDTAGRFLGTLRYAAPEQLRGEMPTAKMDLYAAGLVIYEIVTGRGPFDDEGDAHRVAAAHINKYAPPVSRFAAVPKELEALLMAALAKDPEGRPRDAFSFAASLRNLKRLVQGTRLEATDSRTTAAAVIGPESAGALVTVRQPSPNGPYVISPVSSVRTTRSPGSTVPGMIPPTAGATLTTATANSFSATVPEAVDRMAPTASLVSETSRLPGQGTEMLSVDPGRPETSSATLTPSSGEPPAGVAAVAPIQWPSERSITHSEEPQVQSLPATALARTSSGPIVAAAIGIGALVATAALFVAMRHGSGVKPVAAGVVAVGPPGALALPSAVAVVTVPAPTIAPPELDESIAPSASVAPARPAAASSSARSKIATSAPVKRPTAAPTFAPDRPGPGF